MLGTLPVGFEPLERSAATKLVRATRPLVLHEFRRYARIPLMTEVSVVAGDTTRFVVSSQEISSGGMSLYWMSTPYRDELGDWRSEDAVFNNQLFAKHHGELWARRVTGRRALPRRQAA